MPDLTHRNAVTLVEQAVFNAVNRALRQRLPPAADVAALRAFVTRGAGAAGYQRRDRELTYVTSKAVCYEWSTSSALADDGDLVVRPTDAGTTGRWLKTTSAVQSGYLRDVRLYEGEQSEDEILERLLGQVPSVAIRWERSKNEPKSQVPGSLYRHESFFDLWVVSSNLRGGAQPEAVVGSQVAAEAAADPGVNAVVGDVKSALAGRSGEELGQAGIAYCEIGDEEPVYRSLAERRFVYSVGLVVHATVHSPDTDLVALGKIFAQYQVGDLHEQVTLDVGNHVITGMRVATGGGLSAAVSAGSARIAGVAVAYSGEVRAFAALRWTYRDLLPGGMMVFVETAPFAAAPPVTATAMRVGRTVTDTTGVVDDSYVAATLVDFNSGDPDEIPKP